MASPQRPSSPASPVAFGPFVLDRRAGRLLRHGETIDLRPKAWEVLCYLAERPGELVSSGELFDRIWRGVAVTPQTLMNVIAQLRSALHDDAREPRWLETVRGRGYRFAATPRTLGLERVAAIQPLEEAPGTTVVIGPPIPCAGTAPLLGREVELGVLAVAWRQALAGRGQALLLWGDAGIGKTTLVEAFAHSLDGERELGSVRVTRGQCIEHHGAHEPYLPLLSALEGLVDGPKSASVLGLLRRHAPTWLVQMPALIGERERRRLEREVRGTTAARMLREGASLLGAIARETPTLLVLEDLHWSDPATLDFVALLARRVRDARLLVLCTARPSSMTLSQGVDTPADALRGIAATLELRCLDRESILAYLLARLGDPVRARWLVAPAEAGSAGNPLFLRALVDDILESDCARERGPFVEDSAPVGSGRRRPDDAADGPGEPALRPPQILRDVVERWLATLSDEQRAVVEAASVLGTELDALELAQAVDRRPQEVDADLHRLARSGRVLTRAPEVPSPRASDGPRYAFVHAAYRRAVYDSIPPLRRRELHRRAGEAVERMSGPRVHLRAAELARHFRASGTAEKAVAYLRAGAENAAGRFSHRESVALLEAALATIQRMPAGDERRTAEAQVQIQLGSTVALAEGFSSSRARRAFARAGELLDDGQARLAEKFGVEMLLTFGEITSARWRDGRERATRLVEMVESVPPLLPVACCWLAFPVSAMGDLDVACALLERAAAIEPLPGVPPQFDIRRLIDSQLALVLVGLGRLDRARELRDSTLERSRRSGTQLDLAHSALWATEAAVLADDRRAGLRIAAFSIEISERNAFPRYLAQSQMYHAWLDPVLAPEERLTRMQTALDARRAFGDRFQETVALGLIAQVRQQAGDVDGAAASIAEARRFADATGERHFEVELRRLEGELHLASSALPQGSAPRTSSERAAARAAEECFRAALDLALAQGARHWGRRVLGSLDALLARDPERAGDRVALRCLEPAFAAEGGSSSTPRLDSPRTMA